MRRVYENKKSMTEFNSTGKCLKCNGELKKRQRKWCSWACNNSFWLENISPYVFDWNVVRKKVLERDNYVCSVCKGEGAQVDHILAVVNGGSDDFSNLQTLCAPCHLRKTKKDMMVKRGVISTESLKDYI